MSILNFLKAKNQQPRTRTTLVVLLLLFCLSSLFLGCHPQEKKADLVFINGLDPDTLDPALITGQSDGRIVSELFEGLLRFNQAGEPEPGVASSWEISPDHLTYIFHLRPEARWSDGKPVTADDFVCSWRRLLNSETAAPYSYQLFAVRGAEAFAAGNGKDFSRVGIEAPDQQTLKVTLKNPMPYFLQLCALWPLFPVRIDLIDRVGDDWIKPEHIIGNGPYLLSSWRLNDKIVLQKDPLYWDAKHVSLETIEALPMTQATVAYNFYAAGQASLILDKGFMPPSLLDELRKKNDFHSSLFFGTAFLRFNCSKGPFQDPRVRQAFALVINRSRLTQKITRGGEMPAKSLVPPGVPFYEPANGLGYDPERARTLLAEAGYRGGKGFPLTKYLYAGGEMSEGQAVELQAMWQKELGVSILLARQESKVYFVSMNNLDFDIASSSWIADYLDPNTFLEIFRSGSPNNRTGWGSPAYDELLMTATLEVDATKRFQMLHQAEELLIDEGTPITPLYFDLEIQLYDPQKLGGIEGNLLDKHPLSFIYRKKEM